MTAKIHLLSPYEDLTLDQLIEVTQELLLAALDAASVSRTLRPQKSASLYSMPLVRDLLLSWASQAMQARSQLQFWMETNEYANGLRLSRIGMTFTHGSVLVMELIELARLTVVYTEALKTLIIDTNSPDLPETFK